MAGVEITAPPTPNRPDRTPVAKPIPIPRRIISASDTASRLAVGFGRYGEGVPNDLDLRGVHVPLITPFAADGSVAIEAVRSLGHQYLNAGAAGIVALGTTGEASALDASEQQAVIDICAQVCAEHGAPLTVGIGTNNTSTTIAKAEALSGTDALAAVLVVTPYYVRPSEAGIIAHMRAVADASPVPVIIYNIPYRTGRGLGADSVLALAEHSNIAGIKQAVGSLDADTLRILSEAPEGFSVLGGEDPYLFPTMLLGGKGAITASGHVLTERFVAMINDGLKGRVSDGRAHHEALLPVITACFAEPNPAIFKGVLLAQGRIPTANVRMPMTDASPEAVARALSAIKAAS
ncbi:MAG: 4-hydroxy-tetrahydrodipicolinate synthase [Actinobacteria bacterium]|nr:4-hydroxy-tetrahydrodipicolinate synthase [Actinomycetota bacterium]